MKQQPNYNALMSKWRGMTEQDIKEEMDQLVASFDKQERGMFLVRTAADWIEQAKGRPTPRMLFSEFWFEGELCILFADTNLGKSILAVQIGDSISRGEPVPGFKLEAPAQPVLYFDFELSEKQFESRYSNAYAGHYQFSPNFFRAEMDPDADMPEEYGSFEEQLNVSIEKAIVGTGASVLIIDNLTYLKNETEKARHALPLMKHLKALKQRYGLSILALAHTPKRDPSQPITRDDLQGSKMLMNFCDSSFAIDESHAEKNVRYLKQIKQRCTESIYDSENVLVCHTTKPDNFLQFEYLNTASEWDHLKRYNEAEQKELEERIKAIIEADPGKPAFAVARQLCTDPQKFPSFRVKVSRIMKRISKDVTASNNE